jgi:type II secretory pathway pseudopilin PulG
MSKIRKSAYSLLEAIVAISIVSIIITTSVSVISSSLSSLDENSSNLLATNFAKEAIGYFDRVQQSNRLRYDKDPDCYFVKLNQDECNEVEANKIADGDYDLGFDTAEFDYKLLDSQGSVDFDENTEGASFDANKLKLYSKTIAIDAPDGADESNSLRFYDPRGEGDVDGSVTQETKFVRVILKAGRTITAKVYFYQVGRPDLNFVELTKSY